MNQAQIEQNLQNLFTDFDKETFIYDLLRCYGLPKASITRLQKGNLNLSKVEGEISWKKKLFFKEEYDADLHLTISNIRKEIKHEQRFVIVTDYKTLLAIDTKTEDKLDINFNDLPKHFDFFLPWAGMEKANHQNENPADVKAAEKMAKLFDAIKKENPDTSEDFVHGLNVFLSRLLFCFFAEDTNIFTENQFVNALDAHTKADGSDLHLWFETFFEILDTPDHSRRSVSGAEPPEYLKAFPYVNGNLFAKRFDIPKFTRRSRQAIIDGGEMQWKEINPDIFGSMFQAVIGDDQRGSLGQHYTSVPNIMKVIEPLFLNELYEAFEEAVQTQGLASQRKMDALLIRLSKIKIFDPACGSGNFLIIAYKELRRLEMKIFKALEEIAQAHFTKLSGISLNQFYGIEIDDFAHEVAMLALWLTEHQMNVEFFEQFGQTNPTLPLKDAGNIVQGNACRLDWEVVCPKYHSDSESAEVYILGNPPYLGSNYQSPEQKEDLQLCFDNQKGIRNLDYICCWFIKASNYVENTSHKFSFVSTNSICQGEHVPILWPRIINKHLEIYFAYKSFKWTNSAKSNAGVTVIILGVCCEGICKVKKIFESDNIVFAENISPYLINSRSLIIDKRLRPLSNIPKMTFGSKLVDNGNLILNNEEVNELTSQYSNADQFIRKLFGADEYIKGYNRWCLWITDDNLDAAISIPFIKDRIEKVAKFRLNSSKKATIESASIPHKFGEIRYDEKPSIIIPRVTSEKRKYLTCGYLDTDCVILDRAQAIFDSPPFILSILSSRIHMLWTGIFAGRLETRLNYSSSLCYNTFPFPPISTQRKQEITQCVFRILEEREKHSDKTLAQLYDPDKMPDGLREAHRQNDLAIERCYRSRPFESDEERLEYLFKLYEKMIEEEKNKQTLFEKEKKNRKRKK